jgi:hypothetical protein
MREEIIMPEIGEKLVERKGVTAVVLSVMAISAMIIVVLLGCAVGPDFQAPNAPTSKAYTAGAAQRFALGKDIPQEWWTLLHSEELDQLIRQALADSPTVAAAKARLREADENRRAQYGSLFPAADANISASRQKISGAGFGQPDNDISAFNLYNASVNVSYALDLFVHFALAFGPLITLTRDHILGFAILDDTLIERAVEACWDGIKR